MNAHPSNSGPETLITVRELSKRLRIVKPTLYQLTSQGKIPSIRIGGRIRFDWNVVQEHFNLKETMRPAEEDEVVADAGALAAPWTHLHQTPTIKKDLTAVTARSKKIIYAALSPEEMHPRQIEATLKICAVLGLSPMVVTPDGITPEMFYLECIQLVFITPEHLLESTQSSSSRQLLKLAYDLEQATVVLLLEDASNMQCLVELPAGLPVFICLVPSQDDGTQKHRSATDGQQTFLECIKAKLGPVRPRRSRRTFKLSGRMNRLWSDSTAA